jgi:hypothetical protein
MKTIRIYLFTLLPGLVPEVSLHVLHELLKCLVYYYIFFKVSLYVKKKFIVNLNFTLLSLI